MIAIHTCVKLNNSSTIIKRTISHNLNKYLLNNNIFAKNKASFPVFQELCDIVDHDVFISVFSTNIYLLIIYQIYII